MVVCTRNPVLWGAEIGGSPGLAGGQPSSRFNERPGLQGVRWRVTEQDTQYPPLWLLHAPMHHAQPHTYVHAYVHTYIRERVCFKKKKKKMSLSLLQQLLTVDKSLVEMPHEPALSTAEWPVQSCADVV